MYVRVPDMCKRGRKSRFVCIGFRMMVMERKRNGKGKEAGECGVPEE